MHPHDPHRVNDVWLKPRIGRLEVSPEGDLVAGSYASITLTYVAGYFGVDDTGALRVVTRFASDMGRPQFGNPKGANYVTAEASNGATLEIRYDVKGHVRPWDRTIQIRVLKGFLREGDRIVVRIGDTRRGSPGIRVQTFCEEDFQFRLFVDPIATGCYTEVPEVARFRIVAGTPSVWKAVMPTSVRVGAPFRLRLKAEDKWGNPAPGSLGPFRLSATGPIAGLPPSVTFAPGDAAVVIDGLSASEPGDAAVSLLDADGNVVALANPLRAVAEPDLLPFWGDLHGQSEETIGTRPAEAYFRFARDLAFLDVVGHQGNDFQITRAFYDGLNELTRAFNAEGAFITLPGYEWSGNTGLGGDRNVYFAEETEALHRSSHALVHEFDDLATDCHHASDLFERLRGHDAVVNAHVGGRYADVRVAHDGRIERSMEIHSAWGTFEWLLFDALDMGYRVGVVSNSDDHKGRPGASYPGASAFGAYGGLTCLLLPELSRRAVIECLRRRRHYGTTGNRMILDVRLAFEKMGERFEEDPALGPTTASPVRSARMGDIVRAETGALLLRVSAVGSAPIERIEIRRGRDVLETFRPTTTPRDSRRVRVVWEGSEVRGRGRQTVWDGRATVSDNRIVSARAFNDWNPDKPLLFEDGEVRWQAITTGNFGGVDLVLAEARAGRLRVETAVAALDVELDAIGEEPTVVEAGGLGRRLSVRRLPETMSEHHAEFERTVERASSGDSPFWVCVVQEDGFVAWSSPIYVIPSA